MLGSPVRSLRPFQNRLGRLVGVAATMGLIGSVAPSARANAPMARLALSWSAPPDCPTSAQLKQDVQTLLTQTESAASEPLVVEASVRVSREGRYTLELTANGQRRRLEGPTCKSIAEAAALLLALLLDPSLSGTDPAWSSGVATEPSSQLPPSAAVTPAPVPPVSAPPQRDRVSPPQNQHGATLELIAEVATRVDWGNWPRLEPFIVAGLGTQTLKWRVVGHVGLGGRFSLLGAPNTHLDLIPITVGLEPALRLLRGRWGLEPGVGLELGITHHRSADLTPKTNDALSLALLPLLRATGDLGWNLRGWLGIGAGIPLIRPRWVNHTGDVYHTFGPSIRGELGLQAGF